MDGHLLVNHLILVGAFYLETSLLTSLLVNGNAKRLVGKATAKPISHPLTNLSRNPAVHPVFIESIVKVIVVSKAIVMNIAVNKPEYFLSIFKVGQPSSKRFCRLYSMFVFCSFPYLRHQNERLVRLKYKERAHLL